MPLNKGDAAAGSGVAGAVKAALAGCNRDSFGLL